MGSGTESSSGVGSKKNVEQLGEEEVGDQHEDRSHDHGVGGGPTDAISATPGSQAIVATDDCHPECKEE